MFVWTVGYAGGRTRQFSGRRERGGECLRLAEPLSGQRLKEGIEAICTNSTAGASGREGAQSTCAPSVRNAG
jgi:hypothetical protein